MFRNQGQPGRPRPAVALGLLSLVGAVVEEVLPGARAFGAWGFTLKPKGGVGGGGVGGGGEGGVKNRQPWQLLKDVAFRFWGPGPRWEMVETICYPKDGVKG